MEIFINFAYRFCEFVNKRVGGNGRKTTVTLKI